MRLVNIDDANFVENVTSKMLKNVPSINMVEFDNHTLLVRKEANNSVLDSNNSEVYSYSKLKDDMNLFVNSVATVSFSNPYKALLYVNYKDETTVDYDSVGLRQIDEYTIRFYFKKSMNKDDVMNLLTYNFLVDIDLYDKLTSVNAITKITDYQSKTIENFNSYGPYKVDEIAEDKIILKRNDNYKIKRDDLYKTDEVVIYYIEDKNDANEKFFKGELDYLEYDDSLNSYSSSSLLSHTSSTEMERLVLNSDYDSLISREKDKNKNILSNINFRKAISLAINRSEYIDKLNIDGKPLSTLYTDSYIADNKSGNSYNYSTYGQSVKNSLNNSLSTDEYKISEKDNGYSFLLALHYMYEALLEELQSEKIASLKDGDTISLDVVIKNNEDTDSYIKKIDYLTQTLNTLLESANNKLLLNGKLAYEDKIKLEINTVTTSDYDTKIKDNSFDIIFVTSTGNSSNPFSYIKNFASSSYAYCYEPGLKGKQNEEKIGVDLDDSGKIEESEINTYDYYVNMMNNTLDETNYSLISRSDSEYSDYLTNHNKRLKILSAIEYNILSRYETIPLYSKTTSYFYSRKVSNYLDTYSPIFQYGGFKYLNYDYKEEEWQDYLDKYNHNLSNEYK